MAIKWVFNAVFLGVPLTTYSLLALAYNIYANIQWNRWWAQGNLFLVGNTVYLVYQIAMAIPMVFEIGSIIRFIKPLRVLNLFFAFLYNLVFVASALDLIFGLYYEDKSDFDDSEQGPVQLFLYMFVSYNLIFHVGIVPINYFIMVKEL